MHPPLQGIYAITDTRYYSYASSYSYLKSAFVGGVNILQLRDKTLSDEALLPHAKQIQKICKRHKVLFVINDRASLAIELNADGLHLGSDDGNLSLIRKRFKNIIGISCYGDLRQAKRAKRAGADYVAFGSCFASSTKPQARQIKHRIFRQAKIATRLPICAIGGIESKNLHHLPLASIDMCAIISDIWKQKNITRHTKKLDSFL